MGAEDTSLDTLLLQLRRTEGLLVGAQASLDLALATVQEEHRPNLDGLTRQRDELLERVYQEARRLPAGEARQLAHGELQHRLLPAHVELDRTDEEMVAQLLAAGQYSAVQETRAVNRQALQRMPEEVRAQLGVRLVQRRQLVVRLPSGTRYARELP